MRRSVRKKHLVGVGHAEDAHEVDPCRESLTSLVELLLQLGGASPADAPRMSREAVPLEVADAHVLARTARVVDKSGDARPYQSLACVGRAAGLAA